MCPVELSQEQAIDIFNSLRNQPALETMFHEAGAPILQDNSPRQVTKASAWLRVLAHCMEGSE